MNMKLNGTRMGLVLAASLLMLFGTINTALAWTISGTVTGGNALLLNAAVTLNSVATSTQVGTTTTNSSGFYSFTVADGIYNLIVVPQSNSGFSESVVNGISVSGANVTQNVALLLPTNSSVSGVVRAPDGTGISNLRVKIQEEANSIEQGTTITDSSGNFSFMVAAGTYKIVVSKYSVTNVPTPKDFEYYPWVNQVVNSATSLSLPYATLPLVTLSGKTTDSNGVAVPNVLVYTPNNRILNSPYINYIYSHSVTSNASGNYNLTLLSDSDFSFTLTPPIGSGFAITQISNLNITTDVSTNLVLTSLDSSVTGVVRAPDGTGISNLRVKIQGQANSIEQGSTITDANGNFSFIVAAGTYKIVVSKYSVTNVPTPKEFEYFPWVNQVVNGATTLPYATLPLVTLSGKTTDSNGVAVPNVQIYTPNNKILNSLYYNYIYSHTIFSNASGNYSMTLLSDSDFSFTLTPPIGSGFAITQINNLNITNDVSTNLVLTSLDSSVTGVVRAPDGTGISNLRVKIQEQANSIEQGSTITDANGNFSFIVAAGTYKIVVSKYLATNVPTPKDFEYFPWVNQVVNGATTLSYATLPLVTLSGKTTDSNGVAVPNVQIYTPNNKILNSLYYNYIYSHAILSNASGNYSMTLFSDSDFSFTLTPPSGSGFAITPLSNVNMTTNVLQNIILSLPDTTAPIILSGPTVSSRTDTTATIEWQTNEPAKGSVLYGTSNPPTIVVAESTFKSVHSMPLTGLTANTTYYIQLSATDITGNSTVENQRPIISFTTNQTEPPKIPVILTGPTLSVITHNTAVVEWTTKEPSTGTVVYGIASVPDQTVSDTTLATSHRVTLTGLTPTTTYYLNVTASGAVSTVSASSPVVSFPTVANLPPPPPIVEGPMAINITDTSASIIWTTDKPSSSGVSWNDGTLYGVLADTAQTTSHSIIVTGLIASTLYSYTVSSKDDFGNETVLSVSKNFTTQPSTAPKHPPVITVPPELKNVNHQMALIYWETDEQADSVIEYGLSSALGTTDAKAELNTKHNRPLTGLLAGVKYFFRVSSKDAAGNGPTYSATGTFTTDDHDKGKTPVVTHQPEIIHKDDDKGVVYFETDEPCDTVVEYGEGSELTDRHSDGEKVNKHQATITNLKANTSYNVKVSCTDTEGHRIEAKAGTPSTFMAFNVTNILSDAMINAPGATGFITGSQPDTTAPTISVAPAAIAITGTQATITWTTDEIADSQVNYNLSGQALTLTAGDITKVFSHSIVLTNLTPSTTYQFTVTSTDPSGNPVSSSTIAFNTTVLTRIVSFNSDGGSTVTSQNVANNGTATEPTAPTKTGYTFGGWYSDVALTSAFVFTTTAITADITLYAKWTISSYAISFLSDVNGTLTGTASQTVSSGTSATAVTANPNSGYHFVNWTGTGGFVTTTTNPLTVSNVAAAQTITAHFAIKTLATVTIGNLIHIFDGNAKSATATTDPAGLAVTFTYNGLAVLPVKASSYTVIATISDSNYQGSSTGTLIVQSSVISKPGDCDRNGTVTIAEVQSAINMFLGLNAVDACVDQDGAGGVSIAEVQKTINSFLGL